jgi:hypothetical protein
LIAGGHFDIKGVGSHSSSLALSTFGLAKNFGLSRTAVEVLGKTNLRTQE